MTPVGTTRRALGRAVPRPAEGVPAVAMSEADTRAKLIDPALYGRGWTEEHIKREETPPAVLIVNGRARRADRGKTDYTLRVKVNRDAQPVAVAVIEAKAAHLPPAHGLEQAKLYADAKRLNVPFAFSTNGRLYVEYDRFTGLTTKPLPLDLFPRPEELRQRYEAGMGFALDDPAARPLLAKYPGGEATRRYYQDAAVRAVLEKVIRCEKAGEPPRALLSLATGAGKTRLAVQLLRKIADAGQLRRALFVCDRDELRTQATAALMNGFGADAAPVSAGNPEKNAKILVATYQTLDVDNPAGEEAEANFLTAHYPEDYFSHIVIDECHRSAWGKWSRVLGRNPNAVQVGLTATPRQIVVSEKSHEAAADEAISADNIKHFGEPVYEYDMSLGFEDGYLAPCELHTFDLFHDNKAANERAAGVGRDDLAGKALTDADTGEVLSPAAARAYYAAARLDDKLLMPERVSAMCRSLFDHLLATGGPGQKTIIFCARDRHADAVAAEMGNLYADWCRAGGKTPASHYAFKCTAESGGADLIADLKASSRDWFVATTVDLLTTGVDVPAVRNVVFFKYVRSPISFYQMVGRGTRIDDATLKYMFRVYDYTDATRLFGEKFLSEAPRPKKPGEDGPDPPEPPERTIRVEGVAVRVTEAGHFILTTVDGKATPVSVEEYKAQLASRVIEQAPALDDFRQRWVALPARQALLAALPESGRSAAVVRALEGMADYDLYDVLGELAYGLSPRTRSGRADAFAYKHADWLGRLPPATAAAITALVRQFAHAGTEGLENPHIFHTPDVAGAGGLEALKAAGKPADVVRETKERMFSA